jgi:hypothetical protein
VRPGSHFNEREFLGEWCLDALNGVATEGGRLTEHDVFASATVRDTPMRSVR